MKSVYRKLLSICIAGSFLLAGSAVAYADHTDEINHLLEYIAQSDCTFIRNGEEHGGLEARDHLAGKYNYVKWRVKKTEDFISKIASRSSLSGDIYKVRCEEKEETTEQWLFDELISYRNKISPDISK